MYGVLLESVQYFIELEYGKDVWSEIHRIAQVKYNVFHTHQIYPDSVITSLGAACAQVTSTSYDSVLNFFGRCFVRFYSNLGYDVTIKATGRYFIDFLEGIDNIHSQFCYTYPKMKSPTFYLKDVDRHGCVLVYRTERQGFSQYVMGQLQQIAKDFYDLQINIKIIEKSSSASGSKNVILVTYRLDFNNEASLQNVRPIPFQMSDKEKRDSLNEVRQLSPFSSSFLLSLFPFGVIINTEMCIIGGGEKLFEIWKKDVNFINEPVSKFFKLRRPKGVPFQWRNVLNMRAAMIEVECNCGTIDYLSHSERDPDGKHGGVALPDERNILLKGEMKYIKDINAVIYLCSPV